MNHQTIQQGMIKILLVEDEAVIAISQKAILESLNFQVNIVNSGEKAIEYIKNISEFIHPEYKEIIQSRIQSMDVKYKKVKPKFEKFICLDGSIVDVVVRGIKVFFDGKPSVLAYIQEAS